MDAAPEYTIARATDSDLDGILDLLAEIAAEERWLGTELPLDRPKRKLAMRTTVLRDDALMLAAVAGGKVIGELTMIPERPGRLDLAIAILEPWRGKGLGKALMTQAIAWARAAKAYKIVLEVFPHNASAIALYERMGFVREGLFRRHVLRKSGELWDSVPMGLLLD